MFALEYQFRAKVRALKLDPKLPYLRYTQTQIMNIRNYIDGAFSDPVGGQFLDNIDPSTGNAYGLIPRSQAADVDLAVAAAKAAFPAWSSLVQPSVHPGS